MDPFSRLSASSATSSPETQCDFSETARLRSGMLCPLLQREISWSDLRATSISYPDNTFDTDKAGASEAHPTPIVTSRESTMDPFSRLSAAVVQ